MKTLKRLTYAAALSALVTMHLVAQNKILPLNVFGFETSQKAWTIYEDTPWQLTTKEKASGKSAVAYTKKKADKETGNLAISNVQSKNHHFDFIMKDKTPYTVTMKVLMKKYPAESRFNFFAYNNETNPKSWKDDKRVAIAYDIFKNIKPSDEWQTVTFKLNKLPEAPASQVTKLMIMPINGKNAGEFILDDIQITGANAAVQKTAQTKPFKPQPNGNLVNSWVFGFTDEGKSWTAAFHSKKFWSFTKEAPERKGNCMAYYKADGSKANQILFMTSEKSANAVAGLNGLNKNSEISVTTDLFVKEVPKTGLFIQVLLIDENKPEERNICFANLTNVKTPKDKWTRVTRKLNMSKLEAGVNYKVERVQIISMGGWDNKGDSSGELYIDNIVFK